MYKYLITIGLLLLGIDGFTQSIRSGSKKDARSSSYSGTDYQVQLYYSVGGSAPLESPMEIVKVKSYNPGFHAGAEVSMTRWFQKRWGIRAGLAVENLGMESTAQVKNYITEIIEESEKVKGYFTGTSTMHSTQTYLTIPVSAVYRLSENWNLKAGIHASYKLSGAFDGKVSDGHFREGTPVGPKIVFQGEGGATYDFADDVQSFQSGIQLGAERRLGNHFRIFPTVRYDVTGLFPKDFDAISFSLHNIFLNLGLGYRF